MKEVRTMKNNTVFYGELDRFGYDLTVVGTSESDVKSALMKEYNRAYKRYNGLKRLSDDPEYKEYYDIAKEEIQIIELEMNKVEWL